MSNQREETFDSILKPGDRVTEKGTRIMRGVVVAPEPPITARNVGLGNVLIKWEHLTRPQPERIELLAKIRECPDGGYCYHNCTTGCFRVACCGPLSGVFPGDKWPARIRSLNEVSDGTI